MKTTKTAKGSGEGLGEIVRLKANGEEIIFAIVQHRLDGHGIRFKPAGAVASVYCFECKKDVASGDRQFVDELFESARQIPKRRRINGWRHHFFSLD